MKIAFFGTPSFALPSLEALVNSHHKVVAVVTQPDKPVGRSDKLVHSPVKKLALEHKIPVLQPKRISKELDLLDKYKPDIIVTCAFGQMLRQNVLDYCTFGVINVHASLLPKYRGASPIQSAIINGETKTGVTIMQTDIGMDTGDIILVKETNIGPDETAGELFERLSVIGAQVLLDALTQIEQGAATHIPQDNTLATHFPMLEKQNGKIDFTKTALAIINQIRGMNPWPIAYFTYKGENIRVYKAIEITSDGDVDLSSKQSIIDEYPPGHIICADKSGFHIACGQKTVLSIQALQASGGKVLCFHDFLNGKKLKQGDELQ